MANPMPTAHVVDPTDYLCETEECPGMAAGFEVDGVPMCSVHLSSDAGLTARIRREMVEALEHAGFSTLPTYDDTAIQSALDDGVIVAVSVTGAGYQVYALTEARDRAAILHALADGPSVLANHPHEAVHAALRVGVIRAWGPSATGRTVYALAVREPVAP